MFYSRQLKSFFASSSFFLFFMSLYFSIDDITSNFTLFLFNSSIIEVLPKAAPGGRTPPLKIETIYYTVKIHLFSVWIQRITKNYNYFIVSVKTNSHLSGILSDSLKIVRADIIRAVHVAPYPGLTPVTLVIISLLGGSV